jgi:hypothetical protein
MFADLYGTLAAGPAFGGALIDLVAAPPNRIATEQATGPDWGVYPPAALRVHIVLVALEESGYSDESTVLRDRWTAMFPAHANEAFAGEARPIIHALMHTPVAELRGSSFIEILPYKAIATSATQSRDRMLQRQDPQGSNARALLAATRFAFETSPTRYVERGVEARVLRVIEAAQDDAFRGSIEPIAAPNGRDTILAGQLFERLATLRSPSP